MKHGLDIGEKLSREREERARRDLEPVTPEVRRAEERGDRLDLPWPYEAIAFPAEVFLSDSSDLEA